MEKQIKKLFYGRITLGGYDIHCVGQTREEMLRGLRKAFLQWKKGNPSLQEYSFNKWIDYSGLWEHEIKLGETFED